MYMFKATPGETGAAASAPAPAAASPLAAIQPLAAAPGNAPGSSPAGPGAGAAGGGTIFNQPTPGGDNKTLATVLGEIVWLMSQTTTHKQFFISDLEWMVMTPGLLQQYRLYYAKDRPVGVLFWGFVDDEVEKRLMAGNAKLRPQDWKSGEKLWIVDVIAPFGGTDEMIKDLKLKVFPDRELRVLTVEAGKLGVRVV
jgi:cytolysin-activating lysine-acyltransferase